MSKGNKQTVTTQQLDPSSRHYVERMRNWAVPGARSVMDQPGSFFAGPDQRSIAEQAAPFMNPYQQQVIDATRGEFDHMRAQAMQGVNAQATQAGAFGGSRHGVMAGTRLGELDRAQGQQIGNMLHQGWNQSVQQGLGYSEYQRSLRERQMQEPIFRQQTGLSLLNLGMGPVGMQQATQMPSNRFGSIAGGATAGAAFGPWGALAGGVLGGIFG
jgi:hypothetical protein